MSSNYNNNTVRPSLREDKEKILIEFTVRVMVKGEITKVDTRQMTYNKLKTNQAWLYTPNPAGDLYAV